MPFKISSATDYPWTVSGELAGERWTMTARFRFLNQERIDELLLKTSRRAYLLENGQDDPALSDMTAINMATEVLAGWEDVTDDDGEPVQFTAQRAAAWLRVQGVAAAVATAWQESLQGARRGNSKAPRGIG